MHKPEMQSIHEAPRASRHDDMPRPTNMIFGSLSLSPDQIEAPAFFVDGNLCIRWMATGGTDPFSTALAHELRSTDSRNVFNLLLRPAIKHAISEWRSFFSFVYQNLHDHGVAPSESNAEPPFLVRKQLFSDTPEHTASSERRTPMIDSCCLGGDTAILHVFSMAFDKGMLFMLRQDRCPDKRPAFVDELPGHSPTRSVAQEKNICVLSARLNHAHGMAKRMLPDHFLTMMERIGHEADEIARSLGGKRAPCNGPQLCYGFTETAGRDPIFGAICCATRLNDQMRLLQEKLDAQYGWSDEICLNMGIGHGAAGQMESDVRPALAFVMPGGAFAQANLLSGIAGKGEIWITRHAAAQLPEVLMNQVVLGVDRNDHFVRNYFKKLSDFKQLKAMLQIDPDMDDLSVCQIKQCQRYL